MDDENFNKDLTPNPSPKERGMEHGNLVDNVKRDPHYMTASPEIAKVLVQHARDNRKNGTDAEKVMWEILRNRKLGEKFRRQHPVGIYIVDFVCLERQLIIEIDGDYHFAGDQPEADEERSLSLEQKYGFKVLRFRNEQVILETEYTIGVIKNILA